jgi:hypothetical protein
MKFFHESNEYCRELLDEPVLPGTPCPKCQRPFVKWVRVSCRVCGGTYITDTEYDPGQTVPCPLHGGLTFSGKGQRQPGKLNRRLLIYGVTVLLGIFLLTTVVRWLLGVIGNLIAAGSRLMVNSIATVQISPSSIFLAVVAVTVLVLIYAAIYGVMVLPAASIQKSLRAAERRDVAEALRASFGMPFESPEVKQRRRIYNLPTDNGVLRESLKRSRRVIGIQQAVNGLLIIGIAIGGLLCFLAAETFKEIRQVVIQFLQQGTMTIAVYALLTYSAMQFMKLKGAFKSASAWIRGIYLSLLLGLSTVITLILIPVVAGEASLPGSPVAIGLTINVIGDVLINSYEGILNVFWGNGRLHSRAYRGLKRWMLKVFPRKTKLGSRHGARGEITTIRSDGSSEI